MQSHLALQFLAPAAGLIAAGLAVPALLFFYFLRLRRKPMRVSSTLFWEQAVSDLQVNAPFRWIRASLLLLLQLLALLSLLIAIARPAIDSGRTEARIAIVIDASASMRTIDQPGGETRLVRAKAAAIELLDGLPTETKVIVIEFSGRTGTLTNFTRNRGIVRNAIEGIEQTDQPARLTDALAVLVAFVRRAGEDEAGQVDLDFEEEDPPRVVLFSDGAFSDPPEDRAMPGAGDLEFDFIRIGPTVEADDPPMATSSGNVGITGLSARRSLDDPATVRVFTRLQSNFSEPRRVTLRCSIDGETVAVSTPTIPGAEMVQGGSLIVPTADATFTFDITNTEGGIVSVSISPEDALASDNQAWLILPPPDALRILMVRPDGPLSNGSANLAFALETVFPAPQEVRVITESDANRIGIYTPELAQLYDLIVFDSVRVEATPPIASLCFNTAPPLPGLRVQEPPEPRSSSFLFWRRSHPVMRNVVPDGVVIYRRSLIEIVDPEDRPDSPDAERGPVVRTTELASDPSPLITLHEYGRAQSIVVGFALDQTNWWQDRSFPIFIQNAVDFLTLGRSDQAGRALSTRDPIRITPEEARGGATIVDMDGRVLPVSAPASEEAIEYPPLPRVGIYELLPSEEATAPPRLLAINLLNPFESQAAAASAIEVAGQETSATGQSGARQREIWNWFVLLAILLLTFEWILFDRKMRV
jgi:hypothetical protein